ncbi:hypothetical protein ACRAWG_12590 [Methylobacterium sp. P31]
MSDGKDRSEFDALEVATATGDFYRAYKTALTGMLDDIRNVGADALAANKLNHSDSASLNLGLAIVEGEQRDLLQLLSKIIDESEPSFFEEATVAAITNLIKGVFLVAKHGGFTDSARDLAQKAQAKHARDAKADALKETQAAQNEMVRRHAAAIGADLSRPAKTAEAIQAAINAELAEKQEGPVTPKTIYRWIRRLEGS